MTADEMRGEAEFELERFSEVERLAPPVLREGDLERGRRLGTDRRRGLLGERLVFALFRVEPGEDRFDRRRGEGVVDQRRVAHELAFARIAMQPVEQAVDRVIV